MDEVDEYLEQVGENATIEGLRDALGAKVTREYTESMEDVVAEILEFGKEATVDPHSGQLYGSVAEAKAAGVAYPIELFGRPDDVRHVSNAVGASAKRRADSAKKNKRKQAKNSRRANR